jgi:putative transposase
MIVGMRTRRQAARVAALTGGAQLPGKPKRDGTPQVSRYVDVGADFETHRSAVESVSVLFDLYDGDLEGYAATGRPGQQVPSGWMVTAAKFEVEWRHRSEEKSANPFAFRRSTQSVQLGSGASESRSGRPQERSRSRVGRVESGGAAQGVESGQG